MNKKFLLIVLFLPILVNSCFDRNDGGRYVKKIRHFHQEFEKCYQVEGLFNHFPTKISNKSFIRFKATVPCNTFYPGSVYSDYLYLFLNILEDEQTILPDTFMYKTDYKKSNFIMDDAFRVYQNYDTAKVRNTVCPSAYPIPYFERLDFNLGFETIDLRNIRDNLFVDIHKVPEDLEVYVLKAGYGYFWEIEFDQERPETLGNWKNGYSSGVAISKEHNIAVYWMMAW
jgi:hypothetical protein